MSLYNKTQNGTLIRCFFRYRFSAEYRNVSIFRQSGPVVSSALVSRFPGKGSNVDGESKLCSAELHLECVDGAVLLPREWTTLKEAKCPNGNGLGIIGRSMRRIQFRGRGELLSRASVRPLQ